MTPNAPRVAARRAGSALAAGAAPPRSLRARVCWLFLLFAEFNVVALLPTLLAAAGVALAARAAVAVAVVWLGWHWYRGYAIGRFPAAGEPIEALVALAAGAVAGPACLGLLFVGLYFRSLYGSSRRAAARVGFYTVALVGGLAGSPLGSPGQLVPTALGLMMTAAVMQVCARALTSHEASEERFRLLVEGAEGHALFVLDADGRVAGWNAGAERVTGYRAAETLGCPLARFAAPDRGRPDASEGTLETARRAGHAAEASWWQTADGRRFHASLVVTRLPEQAGRERGFSVVIRDTTEAIRAAEQLRTSERRLAEAQAIAQVGSWELSTTTGQVRWSDEMYRILGEDPDAVEPSYAGFLATVHADDRAAVEAAIEGATRGPHDYAIEYRVVRPDDATRVVLSRGRALLDSQGAVVGLSGTAQDITERRASEDRIAHLAYHDDLTDLPNRVLVEQRLADALQSDRDGQRLTLLLVDLDEFRIVNDSLGHAAGDQLLIAVARRLSALLRPHDLLARHGGDEFIVLLSDAGDDPAGLARTIGRRILDALREPFAINGTTIAMGASIGISLHPEHGRSPSELLKNADAAMYQVKSKGGRGVATYRASDNDAHKRLSLSGRMRTALDRGEFLLHYQPVFALPTLETVGVEALLRWKDPEHGMIAPGDFIPLAEHNGLIEPIGQWVVEEICRQATAWAKDGLHPRISFNLSPRQLRDPASCRQILRTLSGPGLDASRFTVEITESVAMRHSPDLDRLLQEIHDAGPLIAIDDFGTGYSSLSRMRDLPVQILKIDRSLMNGIPADHSACAVTAAVMQLAATLGMRTVAEGIEDAQQLDYLIAHGADAAQGFHLGRPQPADQITSTLAAATRPVATAA